MIKRIPEDRRLLLGVAPLPGIIVGVPSGAIMMYWPAAPDTGVLGLMPAVLVFVFPMSYLGMWTVGVAAYVLLKERGQFRPTWMSLIGAVAGGLFAQIVFQHFVVWPAGALTGATIGFSTWAFDRRFDVEPETSADGD